MPESSQESTDFQSTKKKSVLVVQTAFLGDLLLGVPFFRRIKTPDTAVTLFCRVSLGQFMLDLGLIDSFVEVSKADKKDIKSKWRALRQTHWHKIYCVHESIRSHFGVWTLRADCKVGYDKWYSRLVFDRAIQRPMELPEALRQASLLRTDPEHRTWVESVTNEYSLHLERDSHVTLLPQVPLQLEMHIQELRRMQLERRQQWSLPLRVAIAPGSTWLTKRWPHFAELIGRFVVAWQRPVEFLLVGSPQEQSLCGKIVENCQSSVKVEVFSGSLMQVAKRYAESDLLISNDSGAQHLGSLSGVPTVSLFGPTTLELGYRPWNSEALVLENSLDCRPCGRHGSNQCPLRHHRCMQDLSVASVVSGCLRLLRKTSPEQFRER